MKSNNKKIKKYQGYKDDSDIEISSFVKALLIVLVLIAGIYLFTKFVVKNNDDITKRQDTKGSIATNVIVAGSIFNRPEESYYVIVFDRKKTENSIYEAYAQVFESKSSKEKIYYVDLSNKLNEKYYNPKKENKNAHKLEEISFGDITLIKINKGKIELYLTTKDQIKKQLDV